MRKPPFSYQDLDEIVYLFQGGGALGSYQVGVFHALEQGGYSPDWLVGISIGAINSSIIAGNPPGTRLEKLYEFWDLISHDMEVPGLTNKKFLSKYHAISAAYALMFGQKNFFSPTYINPWIVERVNPTELSFYDTSPLKETLHKVIDFDYLNTGRTRLSVGAVDIASGDLKFFDNRKQRIEAKHIMASCALPPGFPAIEIEGRYYWDGGLYTNTPLLCVVNDLPHKNRLCFLVDLFDSTGVVPHSMDAAEERKKDITYAGHLKTILSYYDTQLFFQKQIANCMKNLPDDIKKNPEIMKLAKLGDSHDVHIAKIVYKSKVEELHSKDYEFSHLSTQRHITDGYLHTNKLLSDPDWWKNPEDNYGTIVHKSAEHLEVNVGSIAEQLLRDEGH